MIQTTLLKIKKTESQIKNFLKEQSEIVQLGFDKDGFHLVACWKTDDYHYSFYCRYCKEIHRHGLGEGHRIAHCNNSKSPYIKDYIGYVLCFQGDLTK